ncbi:MAG: hypothetical protein OXG60_16530 [Chloroflexi bacterium]|nr:hypothetical protein [Chloroflexota bacterium]
MGGSKSKFYPSPPGVESALRQCEILSGLILHQINLESLSIDTIVGSDSDSNLVKATPIVHPYAIIVSQDCDLSQDFHYRFKGRGKARHALSNILFCEVVEAAELVHGEEHGTIFDEGAIRQDYKKNNDFRFHFLQEIPTDCDSLGMGLPELGMVFKRYFSIPAAEAYEQIKLGLAKRRSVLKTPYLEHFTDRFYHYNNRIALPEQYEST